MKFWGPQKGGAVSGHPPPLLVSSPPPPPPTLRLIRICCINHLVQMYVVCGTMFVFDIFLSCIFYIYISDAPTWQLHSHLEDCTLPLWWNRPRVGQKGHLYNLSPHHCIWGQNGSCFCGSVQRIWLASCGNDNSH